jgi:glycerol-3-phosphate acyltransferase PlsY
MPGPDTLLPFLLTAVAAYIIGSVSFSIIFTRIFAKTDVRQHGSGNAGTTNVLRTAGKLPALLTFFGDFIKCVAAICFGLFIFMLFGGLSANAGFIQNLFGSPNVEVIFIKFIAGLFCMAGHIYPIFFGFRGGKGVATTTALVVMISWQVFLIGIGIFIVMMLITKIVSLSVLTAAIALPVATFFITLTTKGGSLYVVANTLLAAAMSAILFITHRANIKRLIAGNEQRMFKKA